MKGNQIMKKTRILRNILLSVGVVFALARLLGAGTSDGALNFNKALLVSPQPTFGQFDPPGAVNGAYPDFLAWI
jgi:hypothetical protein